MKKNMGSADRIIRVIIAAIILVLYFTNIIEGTLCLILLVVSAIFTLTSIAGICPLYSVFGLSTCGRKKK
jgi:Protein of unknown function (DUF2892).